MRLLILAIIFSVVLWHVLPPLPSVSAQSGLTHIRQTQYGTNVYKFDDGPNTCYLADNRHNQTTSQNSTTLAVAISCFPRK